MSAEKGRVFLEMLKESGVHEVFTKKQKGGQSPETVSIRGDWEGLRSVVLPCTKCPELVRNRHTVVFGSGNPQAELMFVGEAPGAEEDRQGLPFVGRAGQLLTKMIEAIQMTRDGVFIANVLKCRPPNNRPPQPAEIANCEPYLRKQLELIRPKIICALGTFAAQTILKTVTPISALRGKIHSYEGIPVICTFHPAYLLRNPAEKKKSWEDLKRIKALLRESK